MTAKGRGNVGRREGFSRHWGRGMRLGSVGMVLALEGGGQELGKMSVLLGDVDVDTAIVYKD